jgi:hypothetical protein
MLKPIYAATPRAQVASRQVLARYLGAGAELAGGEEAKVGRLERGHADMIADAPREARRAANAS